MVAWSYSVLDSFETCAYRHYRIKVRKDITEQQTEQMLHGNRVHKVLENRVKDNTPIPKEFAHYEKVAARLIDAAKGGIIEAEQKMAINASFQPTAFFAKDVWCRGITDVTIVKGKSALIVDYKTGNPNPESAQLRLTAAMTFAHKPYVEKITNTFLWLKTDTVTSEVFRREDIPAIWQGFAPRIQRLEQAVANDKWPKKPSGLCRKHCPVKDCEFNGG